MLVWWIWNFDLELYYAQVRIVFIDATSRHKALETSLDTERKVGNGNPGLELRSDSLPMGLMLAKVSAVSLGLRRLEMLASVR